MWKLNDMRVVFVIETIDDKVDAVTIPIEERLGIEALSIVIINFYNNGIEKYEEMVGSLNKRGSDTYSPKKLDLDLKNRTTPRDRPSVKQLLILVLKALLSYLFYDFLGQKIYC